MARLDAWKALLILSCFAALWSDVQANVIIGSGQAIAGPPSGPGVAYIPGHWYYGYWIPGQYIIWPNTLRPDQQYVWMGQVYGNSGSPPGRSPGGRH